ncbi:MAG: hypothetical protein CBE16_12515 [Rhodospirillaceae bacterium TMED256]|nr:MAG: hypothetical protein CBE16_12515 [Rhodospirillaceae bacterium TMED256]
MVVTVISKHGVVETVLVIIFVLTLVVYSLLAVDLQELVDNPERRLVSIIEERISKKIVTNQVVLFVVDLITIVWEPQVLQELLLKVRELDMK